MWEGMCFSDLSSRYDGAKCRALRLLEDIEFSNKLKCYYMIEN